MPKTSDHFAESYKRLNPEQKSAVDTIEGPVMVVAGPGTGKTQVLTLRIANILRETDTPPDAILALTFTNSGVHAMRARLVELIGSRGYRVNINTFHGWCNEIIRAYPEQFPRIIGSRNASRVEQIKILEKIIEGEKLDILRPYGAPFYYLSAVQNAIEKLKKDNILPSQFAKAAKTEKETELALIYEKYEGALREQKLYDFADMMMEVVALLKKKKTFLRQLQEEYLYLLADEHQDANLAQNELLALLSNYHQSPNLFIVGDEKQAIFQFQGASLENFNYFKKLYPDAKLITLTHNYRSHQNILDTAHSLISTDKLVASGATAKQAEPIRVVTLPDPSAEARWVSQEIKNKIASGVDADHIGVIYRDNADAAPLVEALERARVPLVVQSQTDLLADLTIAKIILILETVHHFGNADYLRPFLMLDFLDLDALAAYGTKSYLQLKKAKGKLKKVYEKLVQWHRLATNDTLLNLFGAVLEDSGLLHHLLQAPGAEEELAKVQLFHEELRELAASHPDYRLADFADYLATLRRHSLRLAQTVLPARAGVRLLTAHGAKGLEFTHVYIVGATEGHFGSRRARTSLLGADDNDDAGERRLFYVALTRARAALTITYARATRTGAPQLPSQFIEELDKSLVEFVTPDLPPADPLTLLKPRPKIKSALGDKAYLNKLFLDKGISATDLNNYLSCPIKYFYQNLLRLPQVQEKYLLYGTAVHAALKEFFDQYREGKKWTEEKLLERLQYHLEQEPFSSQDLADSLEKGTQALGGYYRAYRNKWPDRILNEFAVRGVLVDEFKLNGKIDKLEFSENGEVRVVDYKTGKPKSRNHLMGLTKSPGSGDYFRQLVFYKILLENYGNKYSVTAGLIDFIEPDDKGRYKQEEFALADSDVAGVMEQIQQMKAEVLSLEFLNNGCGKKDCEWCHLWTVTH